MSGRDAITKMLLGDVPVPSQRPDIFEQAKLEYPVLRKLDFGHVTTPSPGDDRMLEFWPPNEPGDEQYPRPEGLPTGQPGVQVISPKTTANDVAADVVSHYLVNTDPTLSAQYRQFETTFDTPQARARLARDYQYDQSHYGETRPLAQWAEQTRIPAYFRGYAFNQWPESAREAAYSPQQRKILDRIMGYLTEGQKQ